MPRLIRQNQEQSKPIKPLDPIVIELPGKPSLLVKRLVLDFTGTLSLNGSLLSGLRKRLKNISRRIPITVLTADTFGKAKRSLQGLPLEIRIIRDGKEKAQVVKTFGAQNVVAIGNGRNDIAMFRVAALGIAVIGPEGAAGELVSAADVVVGNVQYALDLLLNPLRLTATLRD
jgi:soluble P-type ATPase